MNREELTEIVATMRELGVRSYKSGSVEIVLNDAEKPKLEPTVMSPLDMAAARTAAKQRHLDTLFAASSQRPRIPQRTE